MIEFEKTCYKYPGHAEKHGRVLFNIDLRFEKGRFYGLAGRNGSGKSTLVRLVNGLLHPFEGRIFVDGIEVRPENFSAIRKKVGYVFQNPDNQLVSTLVETEVAFVLENLCVSREEMRKRVKEALEYFELSELAGRPPHMLSGGQKQRLALASVMVVEPEYLILDEPASMLDYRGRIEVLKTLEKLRSSGKTVILITHDYNELIMCDEIIVLENGQIAGKETPEKFIKDSEMRKRAGLTDIPEHIKLSVEYGMTAHDRDSVAKEHVKKMYGKL